MYVIFSKTFFVNFFSSEDILDHYELILRKSKNDRFRKIMDFIVWRLPDDARADCPNPSAQRKLFLARKIVFYPWEWESVVKPPLQKIERFVTMKFNDDVSMKIYKNQELFFEQFLIPRSCGSPGAKNGPCYRYYQSRRARTHRAATIGSRSWSRSTDSDSGNTEAAPRGGFDDRLRSSQISCFRIKKCRQYPYCTGKIDSSELWMPRRGSLVTVPSIFRDYVTCFHLIQCSGASEPFALLPEIIKNHLVSNLLWGSMRNYNVISHGAPQ